MVDSIKIEISSYVCTTRFWNVHHQVSENQVI